MKQKNNSRHLSFEGIVINRKSFGEGNSLFTIIDKNIGKINLVGFGVKREKSKRREPLLVANRINGIAYRKNNNEIYSIRECTLLQSYESITSNLKKMSFLFLIFETLNIILPEETLFEDYKFFLATLDKLNTQKHIAKYALFFTLGILTNDGTFPEYSDNIERTLHTFCGNNFQIAQGSLRFIKVVGSTQAIDYWDKKELTITTSRNIIEIIGYAIRYNYDKELKSISMIHA